MDRTEWDYKEFKLNFFKKTGLDLECYKDQQMERRIRHMIQREKCSGFYDFFLNLSEDPDFMHKFMNFITINTSGFFRDIAVYNTIRETLLPELKNDFLSLRIWSAGCSNGEEPYTMAIMLDELGLLGSSRILASDFDEKALSNAREGVYNSRQVEKVPPNLLRECFENDGGNYRIHEKYKRNVTFRKDNLLDIKPDDYKSMHIILCRNVFIYFKANVQENIIQQFSSMLIAGGYFIIGCAEYINEPLSFNLEKRFPAIYRKNQ